MLQNGGMIFFLAALLATTSGCGLAAYRGQNATTQPQDPLEGITTTDPILPPRDPVLIRSQQNWVTSENLQAWSQIGQTSPGSLAAELSPHQLTFDFDQSIQVLSIRGVGIFSAVEHEVEQGRLVISVAPGPTQRLWGGVCITLAGVLGGGAQMRVQYIAGDANGDGLIEDADFQSFVQAYNEVLVTNSAQARFDFDRSGAVDDRDYEVFVQAYNAVTFEMPDPCAAE
jgi:hypothetical protein